MTNFDETVLIWYKYTTYQYSTISVFIRVGAVIDMVIKKENIEKTLEKKFYVGVCEKKIVTGEERRGRKSNAEERREVKGDKSGNSF